MASRKNANLIEYGSTGLNVISGRIYEESLKNLRNGGWMLTLPDMQNDAVINAMKRAIEMLMRQVTWDIEPFSDELEDEKEAQFIRECLHDMSATWSDTISEIISFLDWGWYFPEICYKYRGGESFDPTKNSKFTDGRIGWRKFAPRAQESLDEWTFDDYGEILAMIQAPLPDRIRRTIPFVKALHFRTSSNKGNPEGLSVWRGAYREWFFKVNIQNIEAIGIERDLAGLPVMYAPESYFYENASPIQKRILSNLSRTVQSVHRGESEGLLLPQLFDKNNNPLFKLELLTSGGRRQFDTSKVIDRCDHRMTMSILADFLLLGGQAVGSFALSTNKTELFAAALGAWLDSICDQFNRFAIPRLRKLNGRDPARSPRLKHGPVERVSLTDLGAFIRDVSGANIEITDEEAEWIKRQAIPAQDKKQLTSAKKTTKNSKKKEELPEKE